MWDGLALVAAYFLSQFGASEPVASSLFASSGVALDEVVSVEGGVAGGLVDEGEGGGFSIGLIDLERFPVGGVGEVAVAAPRYIVMDRGTDIVLAGRDVDLPAPMASTTKLMTALVVRDQVVDLGEEVVVGGEATRVAGSGLDLEEGQVVPVRDLLRAVMVGSANDAAVALAEYVGGDLDGFVAMMNERAQVMGLSGTHFENPHGLDAPGHVSTAFDLAQIMDAVVDDEVLTGMMQESLVEVRPSNMQDVLLTVDATNDFVGRAGDVVVGKTGFTDEAGLCFVALSRRGGEEIISVVMNADDRFGETQELVNRVYDGFEWL